MSKNKSVAKHSLWIRWAHWINFPVLVVMVWSGLMIYWANHIYWPHFSDSFFTALNLKHRLAEGMSYHFFFMWIFAVNGILYFFYLLFSGDWKKMVPQRDTFKKAFQVILHDLGFKGIILPKEKFNGAQRIAYTTIVIMGLGSLITGLAIYKPIQLNWLKTTLGGYETARWIHFYLTLGFVLFFFIHVGQVIKAGWKNFRSMVTGYEMSPRVQTVKSFSLLTFWLCFFVVGFSWLTHQAAVDNVPKFFRGSLEFNEKIWMGLLNSEKTDHPPTLIVPIGKEGRVNGDIGLNEEDDLDSWAITVATPMTQTPPKEISIPLAEIKKLKIKNIVTQLKCIEGWSEVRSYEGVPFIEFLNHYHLGTHSGGQIDFKNHPEDLFSYVGLETLDGEYYVSIDMKSMLSPDTLLAFEMNGEPLSFANGAPVRLAISNKYGVKNLKRIGRIQFADSKLPDYWGEQGYDWFIGL